MIFTGTHEHTIDSKNRLAIPSEMRQQLVRAIHGRDADPKQAEGIVLYVTPGEGSCLYVYTEDGFERRAEQLDHSEMEAGELLAYERMFFSHAQRVETDKQGRVRLPESLKAHAGLGDEVVLLGVKDHLEIMDRETWQGWRSEMLSSKPGIMMNPRRAMKAG